MTRDLRTADQRAIMAPPSASSWYHGLGFLERQRVLAAPQLSDGALQDPPLCSLRLSTSEAKISGMQDPEEAGPGRSYINDTLVLLERKNLLLPLVRRGEDKQQS